MVRPLFSLPICPLPPLHLLWLSLLQYNSSLIYSHQKSEAGKQTTNKPLTLYLINSLIIVKMLKSPPSLCSCHLSSSLSRASAALRSNWKFVYFYFYCFASVMSFVKLWLCHFRRDNKGSPWPARVRETVIIKRSCSAAFHAWLSKETANFSEYDEALYRALKLRGERLKIIL